MLPAQDLGLFDVPFPSLVLAPIHVYPDHREYALGRELTVVFDHLKVEYTLGCFSLKWSDAEKNPMAACALGHSSSKKSGRVTSLVVEFVLAYFFSMKRVDELRQTMSSGILVSVVTMSLEAAEPLSGVVDLTHG